MSMAGRKHAEKCLVPVCVLRFLKKQGRARGEAVQIARETVGVCRRTRVLFSAWKKLEHQPREPHGPTDVRIVTLSWLR